MITALTDWYENMKLLLEMLAEDVEDIQKTLDAGNIGLVRRLVQLLREKMPLLTMTPPPGLGCAGATKQAQQDQQHGGSEQNDHYTAQQWYDDLSKRLLLAFEPDPFSGTWRQGPEYRQQLRRLSVVAMAAIQAYDRQHADELPQP